MFITRIKLKNWRNFSTADVGFGERAFLIGPNASGKSNFLDIFRFMGDIVNRGGLQIALMSRGGLSKIQCLSAKRGDNVELEFHFSQSLESPSEPKFKYILGIKFEVKGKQQSQITREEVWENGSKIIQRPDENDKKDRLRLTQTSLEQISLNQKFREIYDYFSSIKYIHIVPQFLKHPEMFKKESALKDDYSFDFLERVVDIPEAVRQSRLSKIETALKIVVPQLKDIKLVLDSSGPHFEAIFEHWEPSAVQREDQFSDGTLRLLGIIWALFEDNSLLLLEEPEVSLNASILNHIPSLIYRITSKKKKRQQILISTHSIDLLSNAGIAGEEVLVFEPGKKGTEIKPSSSFEDIRLLLESGLKPSEIMVPLIRPKDIVEMELFE
jgi:predicted ATPase